MHFTSNNKDTVVTTNKGQIKGFRVDDTYGFYGIQYASAKRFKMPVEIKPWDGVKDALSYGHVCPELSQNIGNDVKIPHRYWPASEDCLSLNLWTKSINSTIKKPVMVWLHGGGFIMGSSIEHVAYDGMNMAKYGDVVSVSINHRLNVLGYLNMAPYGDDYANSGNAGTADMVAALKWIRDNIEQFGGDPNNVTLFGQSGGGMKVWTLMQTPAADGLFHKGIVQSGVVDDFESLASDSHTIIGAILDELELDSSQAKLLATIPYRDLANAYSSVMQKVRQQGEYFGGGPMVNDYYLGNPRIVGFTEHAITIPLLVGTVYSEFNDHLGVDKTTASQDDILLSINQRYGGHAKELITLYQEAYPKRNIADLLTLDHTFRRPTIKFINKRSKDCSAATYAYIFAYDFALDNCTSAWHCSEIPFAFHNIDKVPVCNVAKESDHLQDQVFGAWMNFAKTGSPWNELLPTWDQCSNGHQPTMIFDKKCCVLTNHDEALQDLYVKVHVPDRHRFDPIKS